MQKYTMIPAFVVFIAANVCSLQLEAVSVADFGATGDGRTDDTGAFLTAIERAADQGEPVNIPPGRYLIGEDIGIDHPVQFIGSGHQESVITSDGGSARFFVRKSGTSFRNIGFEEMVEPIALESRDGYVLEDLLFQQCRFEDIAIRNTNRGVIGLSSGNASQRPHRIRNLTIQECLFRNIDAHAINIRANISEARVISNMFLDIVNDPESASPPGGYAIRLGNQLGEDDEAKGAAELQGRHLIASNVIRKLQKESMDGNLMGILLYGDYSVISKNVIEDIDGTADGLDTNAIYLRGSYNRVVSNTIRRISGADDDGALSLKGGMTRGNQHNVIAYNTIEQIHGMSAVEVSTSDLLFFENEINDSPTRGFYHRLGQNVSVTDNVFLRADAVLRTDKGKAIVSGNRFLESRLSLEQRRGHASSRAGVYIHHNHFQRTSPECKAPLVRLANDVRDPFVSLRDNAFRNLVSETETRAGTSLVDLVSNGEVENVEIVRNFVDQAGSEKLLFRIGAAAGTGTFAGNTIVIRDLRGPVMESSFTIIENNTVQIRSEAAKDIAIPALFVVNEFPTAAKVRFARNRIFNHADHLRIDELIHMGGGMSEVHFSGNVVEGNFGRLGDLTGSRFVSDRNTLSSNLE